MEFAVVTLLTSDSYLPGALVTLSSLQDQESGEIQYESVCLVCVENISQATLVALQKSFTHVLAVEQIETRNWEELDLLDRRDLSLALTKLHAFRLNQYKKIIFLDADTLVLRPISQLFALPYPFSAVPDAGWPDAFNSGVMVFEPSKEVFDGLMDMMAEKGSWDGADQGLLNEFFPNWNRLSFLYNSTPSAHYTYAPAYRKNGDDVFVAHFIGKDKPWSKSPTSTPDSTSDYSRLVQKWIACFELHFGKSDFDSTRIVLPPTSFKSSTPALPIPIPSTPSIVIQESDWDPARSSPPRNSALQMAELINPHYGNIWDASTAEQRTRFIPPTSYPSIPASTHEWYKDTMKSKPDPTKVRPIFPFEQGHVPASSRSFPADEAPRALPSMATPAPVISSYSPAQSEGFKNAWDSIPAINRYAQSLARSNNSNRSSIPRFEPHSDLSNRQSSLAEATDRVEEGSRDGDDEESAEEEEVDKIPIPFRSRSGSRERGETENVGLGLLVGPSSPVKSRGYVPLSPRVTRQNSLDFSSGNPFSTPINPPQSPRRTSTTAPSPRLVATAIKNSYSITPRNIDIGDTSATPIRASRVFAPETDVDAFKSRGLAALRKFVGKN